MRYLAIALLLIPTPAFAAAGFADAYYDHQQWIFPAYAYLFIFALLILSILYVVSSICKTKMQEITGAISSYLIRHRILAIIVTGVLLAIPLGLMGPVSWEFLWYLALVPGIVLIFAFQIGIVNSTFREKYLLSQSLLKWCIMISISAIAASFLFAMLTNRDMLPGTDVTYLARPGRLHPDYYYPTHPYDSLIEIWRLPILFIAEIPFAIVLYWLGSLNRYLRKKILCNSTSQARIL